MPLSHDWKPINGFEGYYVSKSGDVFSRKRNVVLKHSIHRGYHAVKIYANGKGKSKFVHRLVAEAFIENPNNYPCVNHKDENKLITKTRTHQIMLQTIWNGARQNTTPITGHFQSGREKGCLPTIHLRGCITQKKQKQKCERRNLESRV